jgi:hypothetical protein
MDLGTYLLVLIIATIAAAVVVVWYRDLIWPETVNHSRSRRTVDRHLVRPTVRRRNAPAVRSAGVQRPERVQQTEPHQAGLNPRVQHSAFKVQSSDVLVSDDVPDQLTLTATELKQLTHAIVLFAQLRIEQPAIEQAFGCAKGGSKAWRRAKELFDSAQPKAFLVDPATSEE